MVDHPIKRRTLGSTGIEVSILGLGGAWLGYADGAVDEAAGVETVLAALELGINLIDTSAQYLHGRSERIIGRALSQWYRNGGKRGDVVLSTKTGTRLNLSGYDADTVRESVALSLDALATDYIDVLHVHDPRNIEEPLAPGAAFDELARMKAEGIIRAVGLGVRDHDFHRSVISSRRCDVCLTFGDYNLMNSSALGDVIEPATSAGLGVLNGMITGYGLLGGPEPRPMAEERLEARKHGARNYVPPAEAVNRAQAIWEKARELGIGILPFTVQYSTGNPLIASTLMGASSPEQIQEDVAALHRAIPPEAWEAIAFFL